MRALLTLSNLAGTVRLRSRCPGALASDTSVAPAPRNATRATQNTDHRSHPGRAGGIRKGSRGNEGLDQLQRSSITDPNGLPFREVIGCLTMSRMLPAFLQQKL